MIRIEVQTKDDGLLDITANGHADPKVCSAVSALLQSSIRYMQDLQEQYPDDIRVNLREVE